MKETYLVQRLEKPQNYTKLGLAENPFSFGGGLRNGGLSADAMNLLRPIFGFDYMGAAEYEFGVLPKALSALAGDELVFGFIPLDERMVAKRYRYSKGKKTELPLHYFTVWYICRKDQKDGVIGRIIEDAKGKLDIKNGYQQFSQALRMDTEKEYKDNTIGWLELDNGFFYFVDEEAAKNTAAVFGVGE